MKASSREPEKERKTVAVVVPTYKKRLSPEEKISHKHLVHFLNKYDKYLVTPKSLDYNCLGFKTKRFDDKYFKSIPAYSQLMLSRQFYEVFGEYKYILIYQYDCLVFSDQLIDWCEAGFDYIGAPWLKAKNDPRRGFSRVGNGGFSLRKVSSFLKVTDFQRHSKKPMAYNKDRCFRRLKDTRNLNPIQGALKKIRVLREVRKGVDHYIANYTLNEDHFWSDRAKLFNPDFQIAPIREALKFSFDAAPRYCFEQNNYTLPFGCHAWHKHEKAFWQPYLIK